MDVTMKKGRFSFYALCITAKNEIFYLSLKVSLGSKYGRIFLNEF
jgi:hypothetical protein